MTSMNNLQEVLNHLVMHDTSVYLYGGKQTLFAMYGISKTQIGEPVILIDRAFVQSIKQELQERNITKNRDNI
jgi:hypothetical protein